MQLSKETKIKMIEGLDRIETKLDEYITWLLQNHPKTKEREDLIISLTVAVMKVGYAKGQVELSDDVPNIYTS